MTAAHERVIFDLRERIASLECVRCPQLMALTGLPHFVW